jgi:transposase InsO family protein
LESRIRLMVSVRFGGKFSETWHGDMSRRTVLTLQGSQYTDRKYQALLRDHDIRASMNSAGSWYDNAPMESTVLYGQYRASSVR